MTQRDLHLAGYTASEANINAPTVDDPQTTLRKLEKADLPQGEYDKVMSQAQVRFAGTLGGQPNLFQYQKVDPNRRTSILAKVIIKDGRLYNVTGHPIVNYDAAYPLNATYPDKTPIAAGTPILEMLRVNRRALVISQKLADRSYKKEIDDLEAGIIPPDLRALFKTNGIPLSNRATVTSRDRYAWLVVDRGNSYLVEGVVDGNGGASVDVSHAELEVVHSDLTAMITGPNAGRFPYNYESPDFRDNPANPDRRASPPSRVRICFITRRPRPSRPSPSTSMRTRRMVLMPAPTVSPSTMEWRASVRRSWPTAWAWARWATATRWT